MLSFQIKHCGWVAPLAFGMILMLGLCACDDGDWNHTPPAGMGSIIVDNRTVDGVNVYLDGYYTNRASDFDYEAYDLAPGIHRVVLDESHGDRNWWGDVDVLEGKLTVLEVNTGYYISDYDVRIYFD
ncbi:MAG: hypothetical protein KJ964_10345 [Verrucomicrobia bacterium]|nr:hypothetical protein [Verrucomicrobiota bacterium]